MSAMAPRLFSLWLLLVLPGLAAEYRFTLDGEIIHPTIYPVDGERFGKPAKGDLGIFDGWRFVVPEPGHYALTRKVGPAGTRFLLGDRTVGFVGKATTANDFPPPGLDPAQLWGVQFKGTGLASDALERIDPGHCAVSFTLDTAASLPPLPATMRYLAVEAPDTTVRNTAALASLPSLKFLELKLPGGTDLRPCFSTEGVAPLVNLSVEGGHGFPFPAAPKLRFLKLRGSKAPEDPARLAHYPDLRVLKLDGSEITDLREIQPALPELRLLSAHDTPLAHLAGPEASPKLRDLRIGNTPVLKNRALVRKYRAVASVSVKNWEPSIRAFEKWDAENELPEKPVLFVGSSSIRFWKLKKAFPDVPTLNRGFGGSELSDSLQYFDRIVLPYRPRAILLYAGDNDVGRDESAEQVVADYKAFAAKVRSKLPKAHFAFLPIKPSPARWDLWPEMQEANEAIRRITEGDARLHYLDTVTPMLGEDGKPRPDFFLGDQLHMNARGYEAWNAVVGPWLKSLE